MASVAETVKLIIGLELKDGLTRGLKAGEKQLGKFEKRVNTIGPTLAKGAAVAGAAVAAGVGVAVAGSVRAASEFEAQLNTINTVAQEGAGGLERIGDGIRALARETGTSHEELTAAYYDLVSAGISAADAQDVLTQANKLAIGGLSTTAEAVDLLTTAINSYGGDASQAATFTNYFAQAIGAGKTTASDIAASFAQVGPLAAQFGVGVDEIAAALGVMTAQGTKTPEAMTQIRSAMVALMKPNEAMNALMEDTGVNFAKLAQKKGLAFAYNELTKAAKKAGIPMAKLTGRIEGSLFAAQVAGDRFGDYAEELENVRESTEGVGVAQRQMDQRTKGASFAFNRLRTNLRDVGITLGSALLPPLAELSNFLSEELAKPGTVAAMKELGKGLANGLRDAVKFAKQLPWEKIGDGLKAAAGFAKGIVTAFTSLPAEAQATIIALAGLNKLSGGAVSGIVGELGKGLIKGVLNTTAAVMNVKAGVVNGLGGMGGGKGGGLLPKAGGLATLGIGGATLASVAAIAAGVALPFVMFNVLPELFKGRKGSSGPTVETITSGTQATEAVWNTVTQSMQKTYEATTGVREKVSTASADIRNGFSVQETAIKNGFTTMTTGASKTSEIIRNGFNVQQTKISDVARVTAAGDERTTSRIAAMDSALGSKLGTVAGAVNATTNVLRAKNFSPRITVPVSVTTSVSVRAVTNQQVTVARYTGGTSTGYTIR